MKYPIRLIISFLVMLTVVLGLPFFSAEGYSIIKHTTSQLGAQKTPNALIMNLTFVLLGISGVWDG